jgi:hypothetical protein
VTRVWPDLAHRARIAEGDMDVYPSGSRTWPDLELRRRREEHAAWIAKMQDLQLAGLHALKRAQGERPS